MGYLGRTKPSETTSSVLRSTYTGNGSTTTYALPGPVANETSIIATINGVTQQDAAYSTDGSNIIFVAAPALGDSIEIRTLSAVAMSYAPSAGSVVTGIIADGAVTSGKLATGAAIANIGSRAITAGQMPAGTVLQVINATRAGASVTTTSTSDVSFGATASITPTSSSSKIYVIASGAWYMGGGGNSTEFAIAIQRNGTTIPTATNDGLTSVMAPDNYASSYVMTILDSPATTSSTTYLVVAHRINPGTSTLYNGVRASQLNEITLMEIAQ